MAMGPYTPGEPPVPVDGGGGGGVTTSGEFSHTIEITSPTVADTFLWVAAFDCTLDRVRAIRTGGSGATINAKVNSTYALASDLSLPTTAWTSSVDATPVVAGDVVSVSVISLGGSPTGIIFQLDFSV